VLGGGVPYFVQSFEKRYIAVVQGTIFSDYFLFLCFLLVRSSCVGLLYAPSFLRFFHILFSHKRSPLSFGNG
jgi:hypothetical protein